MQAHLLHNGLEYVVLDCVKDISHKVGVSGCCLKCGYFSFLAFILRLEPTLNIIPERINIRSCRWTSAQI